VLAENSTKPIGYSADAEEAWRRLLLQKKSGPKAKRFLEQADGLLENDDGILGHEPM